MSESLNRINTGRDCKVVLVSPYGRIDFGNVIEWQAKQDYDKVESKPMNATKIRMSIPDGWQGSWKIDRISPAADDLATAFETDWADNGVLKASTIFQTINELDGSQSNFIYEGVSLEIDDLGSWKKNAAVSQSVSFYARRRRRA